MRSRAKLGTLLVLWAVVFGSAPSARGQQANFWIAAAGDGSPSFPTTLPGMFATKLLTTDGCIDPECLPCYEADGIPGNAALALTATPGYQYVVRGFYAADAQVQKATVYHGSDMPTDLAPTTPEGDVAVNVIDTSQYTVVITFGAGASDPSTVQGPCPTPTTTSTTLLLGTTTTATTSTTLLVGTTTTTTAPPAAGGLDPPTSFCSQAAPAANAAGTDPPAKCARKTLVTAEEKAQARGDLRDEVLAAAYFCNVDIVLRRRVFAGPFFSVDPLKVCIAVVDLIGSTLAIVHDPPDRSFGVPPLPPAVSSAPTAAGRCSRGLDAATCAALNTDLANYANVVAVTASVADDIAEGANRLTAAVQANAPASAFLQQAVGKANAGALVTDFTALQLAGQALAELLRADQLDKPLGAHQVKKILSRVASRAISKQLLDKLVAEGVASSRKAARKLIVGELKAVSGTVDSSALGASLPSSAFASEYESITLSELAAIVSGVAGVGRLSSADAQTLTNDLADAQAACSEPAQRIAALQQFIADAGAHASASDADFLRLGAQALTANDLPASSCQ